MFRKICYVCSVLIVFFCFKWTPDASAKPNKPVKVDIWSGKASINNGIVQVQYHSNPLELIVRKGNKTVFKSASDGFLSFKSNNKTHDLQGSDEIHRLFQGFRTELKTKDGQKAQLQVTLDSKGQLRIEFTPEVDHVDGVTVNLNQTSGEHYYGLGDVWHTKHVDLKGSRVVLWDESGTPDQCSYVPFFMSTAGYGIFMDNSYYDYVDFSKANQSETSIHFDASSLSMHLWVGDTMKEILPQYLNLTGHPPMPPKWTFLPQQWRDEGTWDDVFKDVHMMQQNDMPLGAVWLDRPWMRGGYGSDDFIFDEKRYPDAEKHIKELHSMGVHLIVWGCDFLTRDSKYYKEGKKDHYFVGGFGVHNEGVDNGLQRHLIDFANPAAREWFKGIIKNVLKMGVDGIKLDRGQNYPVNVTPPSGRDPKAMHNYHAYLMDKTYAEALQEVRGNDYQFTPRAGWAGTQAWSMKWPGDMESNFSNDQGLPAVVRAQQTAALTGFAFWGSDIGGYGSNLSKNVFIRWLEFGTFSPLMETAGKGDHNDSPFSWDKTTVTIYKFYSQLRKNMIPYIEAQAKKAHEEGTPIVRPLAWDWPDDSKVFSLDYEYMFGQDLLVAPVVNKTNSREVYLPKGKWIDFWDRDRVIEGPIMLNEKVPLWKIPLFIRAESPFKLPLPDVSLSGK